MIDSRGLVVVYQQVVHLRLFYGPGSDQTLSLKGAPKESGLFKLNILGRGVSEGIGNMSHDRESDRTNAIEFYRTAYRGDPAGAVK